MSLSLLVVGILLALMIALIILAIQYGKSISEVDKYENESKARDYKRRLRAKLERLRK